jgi:hypothetical protein
MVVHPMMKHAEIIWEMLDSLEYKQLGQSSAKNMGIYMAIMFGLWGTC